MKCRECQALIFKAAASCPPYPGDSGIFPEPEGFDALEAGAVDFVRKPDEANGLSKEIFLSTPPLQTCGSGCFPRTPSFCSCRPSGRRYPQGFFFTSCQKYFPAETKDSSGCFPETVIAIGASTGGTEAILEVVKNFPADTPGVVITQHMPAGFTAMYAERLNRICKMEVREAKNGTDPQRSHAFSSRRSADACGTSWKLLCSQCTGRRKGKRTQTFRGCAF